MATERVGGDAGPADLAGRVAAVTGAGSGLGAAMCRRFAEAGLAVAALDIDQAAAAATAATLAVELGGAGPRTTIGCRRSSGPSTAWRATDGRE